MRGRPPRVRRVGAPCSTMLGARPPQPTTTSEGACATARGAPTRRPRDSEPLHHGTRATVSKARSRAPPAVSGAPGSGARQSSAARGYWVAAWAGGLYRAINPEACWMLSAEVEPAVHRFRKPVLYPPELRGRGARSCRTRSGIAEGSASRPNLHPVRMGAFRVLWCLFVSVRASNPDPTARAG